MSELDFYIQRIFRFARIADETDGFRSRIILFRLIKLKYCKYCNIVLYYTFTLGRKMDPKMQFVLLHTYECLVQLANESLNSLEGDQSLLQHHQMRGGLFHQKLLEYLLL